MGQCYIEHFTISYFGTDDRLMLMPSSLAVYFQELAISHSNSIGYTLELLGGLKRGWAITNWHIVVNRFPKCGETIKITTWSNYCKKMQAQRFFRVEDENHQVICLAASRWVFMDLERRRPARLLEDMEERFVCDEPSAIENEKYEMPKALEENAVAERVFIVTRRDTDTNGHANNTKYIEWAMDDVPDDIFHAYETEDIRVVYRKECRKGQAVMSRLYLRQLTEGKKEAISLFLDAEKPETVFAEIATIWKLL